MIWSKFLFSIFYHVMAEDYILCGFGLSTSGCLHTRVLGFPFFRCLGYYLPPECIGSHLHIILCTFSHPCIYHDNYLCSPNICIYCAIIMFLCIALNLVVASDVPFPFFLLFFFLGLFMQQKTHIVGLVSEIRSAPPFLSPLPLPACLPTSLSQPPLK